MKTITVKNLTDESFRKYGFYQDMLDVEQMKQRVVPCGDFMADLIQLDFGGQQPTVSLCHAFKKNKKIIEYLECHKYTGEGIMPIDDDIIIDVGVTVDNDLKMDVMEAFYIPKGTFVKFNSMIAHGDQFPVHNDDVHVLCLLPGRTFANDVTFKMFESDDEKLEILEK